MGHVRGPGHGLFTGGGSMKTKVISGATNQYGDIGRAIEFFTVEGWRVVALSQSQNGWMTVWVCALEKETE